MGNIYEDIKQEVNIIKSEAANHSFGSPILLSPNALLFPDLQIPNKALVISLMPNDPFIFLLEDKHFYSTLESKSFLKLRKEIGRFEIKDIKLNPDDLIVEIDIVNEDYRELKFVVELISRCANFILLEDNKVVETLLSYSNRKLIKGKEYFYPSKPEFEFNKSCTLSKNERLSEILENRFNNKYADFKKYIHNKVKISKRKIDNIEQDKLHALEDLKSSDIADEIFTLGLNMKSHLNEITLSNSTLKLDESKTLLENVEKLYKKAKKAKITLDKSDVNLANAKKEYEEFLAVENKMKTATEKEADDLVSTYGIDKKKKEIKKTEFNRPWKVNLNGTIIYFGRNASQNDYLSFVMKLDREFTWLHIKDKSGAHLVIANPKPTEKEILVACEIALLCSRCTTGEIVYTKKKNVRRGHTLGEAILKNHSTIKLNTVSKETTALLETAKRCD